MNPHYLAPLFDPKSLLVYVPAADVSSIADLLRDAEIVNVAFLAVLGGCSARRVKCRVARPHKRDTTTQCARQ